MKFLIDEDIPVKLLETLARLGHDAIRVNSSTPDSEIALQSKKEGRILITLDKDFTNSAMYPPEMFTIIRIQIHPPFADDIIASVEKFLSSVRQEEIKGLIILSKNGHLRFS